MEFKLIINGLAVDAFYSEENVQNIFLPLLWELTAIQKKKGGRVIVLFAAPPGAGKSTLVTFLEMLAKQSVPKSIGRVQAIGMDGFHRRQAYLSSHTIMRDGEEITMARIKGAPDTFDLGALTDRLRRAASGEKCGWPIYDRRLHDPVDNVITVDADIILLEGNYLLLDIDGWRELRKYADYTVFIHADENMLRKRLTDRKALGMSSYEEAARFVEFSDFRNVRTCLNFSGAADLELEVDENNNYHRR